MVSWSAEKVAELRLLWATTMSNQQIADKMGIKVGAVSGKANSLGLPMRRFRDKAKKITLPSIKGFEDA